jgi:membrane AbrB-like protein
MAERSPMLLRWCAMLGFSAVLMVALEWLSIPAAILMGAMLAGIIFSVLDKPVKVSKPLFSLAQAVVGAMIARAIPLSIFQEMARQWPLFLGSIFSVIAISLVLGWLLARFKVLPGSTAIWGSSPGGASAMTLMAESFGADVRLVAFMQYLRVVIVVLIATLVTRFWGGLESAPAPQSQPFFPALDSGHFAMTLGLIVLGFGLARVLRLPAGPMLITLVLGVVMQDSGLSPIILPPWLLLMAWTLVGWSIGLRFNREILRHVARAFPRVLLSILSLVLLCCGLAWGLVHFAGIDPLTAYLATSPGGADSMAIIAADGQVDMPFVMAMQTGRFLIVLMVGPPLSRFVARRLEPAPGG